MSETERIIDQLERAFDGDPWYGDSLREILGGVSAEKAAARLFPQAHSIWELVLHMTFTEEIFRRRIEGERAEFSDSEDFPAVGEISETAWQQALENLESSHRSLKDTISRLNDQELGEIVAGGEKSKYFLLHGLIQHRIYHAGQIALLKKALSGQRELLVDSQARTADQNGER